MISLNEIDSATASVEIKTAGGQALAIDGSGYLTVNGNGTFAVSATDFDIRDLTSASDSVEIKTAGGQAMAIDGSGYLTVNGNGTFTVSATDLDIRDLAFATDSVTAHQGGTWSVDIGNVTGWKTTNETVGTSAGELVATPLASRSKIEIQNLSNSDIYIGPDNLVTTSNGLRIPKRSSYTESLGTAVDVFAIGDSASLDVRVAEYAS